MRVLATIFACMLTATAVDAAEQCGLKSVGACTDTNRLVWSESFEPALKAFLGKRRVGWFGRQARIADVVREVLSGPPDEPVKVADGLYRFSAVRPHSATERGAIFIAEDGTIKAAGVLHFNCGKQCAKTYSLSILLPREDKALAQLVQAWGTEQMKRNEQNGWNDITTIGRVEVLTPDH